MDAMVILNNRYKLTHTLGKGGMSVVYSAYDQTLDRPVAVKVLKEELSRDPAFRERFHLEAKAAANLTHPTIVTVHDFGLDQNRLFIVMEHVPGTDMKTILLRRGRFPLEEAVPLIIQACSGIGYAHRAGLVHCDIKPHNLLITPDMRLKVTDFGIARALSSISPDERTDEIWGSPQYLSPEQAAGLPPQPASDVYSLGVVIYEMVTGQPPFHGRSVEEYANLHLRAEPLAPSLLNPDLPAELEDILFKVLSKQPTSRYRTADQLGRVIQNKIRVAPLTPLETNPFHLSDSSWESSKPVQPPSPSLKSAEQIDWITIGLGLLSITAVGGLIPLWMAVLFNLL